MRLSVGRAEDQAMGAPPEGYSEAVSASTVIQDCAAVATAAGFVVAAGALIQAKKVSRAQNFFTLTTFLQDPKVREARRRVLDAHDDGSAPKIWKDVEVGTDAFEVVLAAGLAASSYDLTGRVVELGYVDYEPFLDDWGPSIKKVFRTLRPFIGERREQHNDERYFDNFERLVESVKCWENARASPKLLRRLTYARERRRSRRVRDRERLSDRQAQEKRLS